MKRCLLTGGGGGVGVHVIAHIMETTDWRVVVLDSFRHKGDPARVRQILNDHPEWACRVAVLKHDLCCAISPELAEAIGDVDYIVHLAAMSDVAFSVENPVYVIRNNVESTLTMLEYARHTPHKAFVYFSTDEVYGPVARGEAHPEWDAHRPSNAYSASKAASEDICYAYWRKGDVKLVITNTMNNFGEMQSPSKFPAMVGEKVSRGEVVDIHTCGDEIGTRYYIHSRDAADALLFILRNGPHLHEQGALDEPDRYHIVGSACLDNLELATRIAGLLGKPLETRAVDFHRDNPAHDIHYGLSDNKLRAAGWSEPIGFDAALAQTVAWEEEHRCDW
jgi:dTDP-glucose 4,6-dehydratase